MKKILLFIATFLCTHVFAQINVGSNPTFAYNRAGKFTDEYLNNLKNTTTLFTLQSRDYENEQDFEKAIASVWHYTKFKIVKPEEIAQYINKEGYSFFSFGGFYAEGTNNSGAGLFSMHLTYDLWIPHFTKKGKLKGQNYYSRNMLCLDGTIVKDSKMIYNRNFSDNMIQYIYNDAIFSNWGAGFLKNYLKTIQDVLDKGDIVGPFTSIEKDELATLKRDTLYIPSYVNVYFNPLNANESNEDKDESDLGKAYPHPTKFISTQQLNQMLLSRNDNFCYLVYVRTASDKFVDVYQNGKGLIYAHYTPISYNFKNKDLAKIFNAIGR